MIQQELKHTSYITMGKSPVFRIRPLFVGSSLSSTTYQLCYLGQVQFPYLYNEATFVSISKSYWKESIKIKIKLLTTMPGNSKLSNNDNYSFKLSRRWHTVNLFLVGMTSCHKKIATYCKELTPVLTFDLYSCQT